MSNIDFEKDQQDLVDKTASIQSLADQIQMLEGLHADEAKVLIDMKNKTLNKTYKGLTSEMVKEAFGWNADFVKP